MDLEVGAESCTIFRIFPQQLSRKREETETIERLTKEMRVEHLGRVSRIVVYMGLGPYNRLSYKYSDIYFLVCKKTELFY